MRAISPKRCQRTKESGISRIQRFDTKMILRGSGCSYVGHAKLAFSTISRKARAAAPSFSKQFEKQ